MRVTNPADHRPPVRVGAFVAFGRRRCEKATDAPVRTRRNHPVNCPRNDRDDKTQRRPGGRDVRRAACVRY